MEDKVLDTPGRLIGRAARLMQRRAEPMLAPIGLAVAQLPVLAALKHGEQMTQKQLAALIGTEQPTMAQLLARMERAGLLQRTPNPEDGRSSYVSLSEHAKAKLPAAREMLIEGNKMMTAGLTEGEVHTLMTLLGKIIANLEKE